MIHFHWLETNGITPGSPKWKAITETDWISLLSKNLTDFELTYRYRQAFRPFFGNEVLKLNADATWGSRICSELVPYKFNLSFDSGVWVFDCEDGVRVLALEDWRAFFDGAATMLDHLSRELVSPLPFIDTADLDHPLNPHRGSAGINKNQNGPC